MASDSVIVGVEHAAAPVLHEALEQARQSGYDRAHFPYYVVPPLTTGRARPELSAWPLHSYSFSVLPVIHPRQERDLLKQTDGYVRTTPLTRSDRLLSSNGATERAAAL